MNSLIYQKLPNIPKMDLDTKYGIFQLYVSNLSDEKQKDWSERIRLIDEILKEHDVEGFVQKYVCLKQDSKKILHTSEEVKRFVFLKFFSVKL